MTSFNAVDFCRYIYQYGLELDPSKVKIDGDIKVRENSNISVIVPNSDSDQAENEGVVIFVDSKNQKLESIANDTLVEKPFVNDFVKNRFFFIAREFNFN